MFDDSVVLDVLAYKPEPDKLRFEVPTGTNHFETSFGSGWVAALTQANLSDYATTFVLALPVINGVLSVAVDPEDWFQYWSRYFWPRLRCTQTFV